MKKFPRMTDWLLLAIVLSLLIFALFPQQLPVSLYKINLITIAGVVGYWLDRSLFPYARPDIFQESYPSSELKSDDSRRLVFLDSYVPPSEVLFAVSMIRRAIIVAAAMIAVGLGN